MARWDQQIDLVNASEIELDEEVSILVRNRLELHDKYGAGAISLVAEVVINLEGVPPMASVCDPGRGLMMVRAVAE